MLTTVSEAGEASSKVGRSTVKAEWAPGSWVEDRTGQASWRGATRTGGEGHEVVTQVIRVESEVVDWQTPAAAV